MNRDAFVFDACVLIDLNIEKVDFLFQTLNLLSSDNDLHISNLNLDEFERGVRKQKELKEHGLQVYEVKPDKFESFRSDLKNPSKNILGGEKDLCVLFVANELSKVAHIEGDIYVVSSDEGVQNNAKRLKNRFHLQALKIISTVGLFNYMYDNRLIEFPTFTEKTLQLFKRKEIQKYMENIWKAHNLRNLPQEEIIKVCKKYEKALRERFQIYKDPLIENAREISREVGIWTTRQ